ncbi:MAG: SDR family oxidoreductase [Hyphomonadaceae bacterium]
MDLGIAGRTAIVCGASKGLGRGVALALAKEGVNVVLAARSEDALKATAKEIADQTGAKVDYAVADVTTEDGRKALLAKCPAPDILINNAGGPPPGDFRKTTREDWISAIDANMLSAIELIKATIDPMIERKFGRIVSITSHMVKQPVGFLSLSNGARAGLTGFVGGVARDVIQHNVTLNNMLPGQFDTDRLASNHSKFAAMKGLELDQVRKDAVKSIPAGRFGSPEEFGAAAAFLCSAHAGYITGTNLLLDGGQYPGLI